MTLLKIILTTVIRFSKMKNDLRSVAFLLIKKTDDEYKRLSR